MPKVFCFLSHLGLRICYFGLQYKFSPKATIPFKECLCANSIHLFPNSYLFHTPKKAQIGKLSEEFLLSWSVTMFAVNLIRKVNTSTSKRQKHSLILHNLWKSISLLGLKIMLLHSWLKQEEKGKKSSLKIWKKKIQLHYHLFFFFQGELPCQASCLTNRFLMCLYSWSVFRVE